jgi:hypothetical protein
VEQAFMPAYQGNKLPASAAEVILVGLHQGENTSGFSILAMMAILAIHPSVNRFRGSVVNLCLDGEKVFAPWLALAFRAFIDGVSNAEAVVARLAVVAGKFLALRAGIKWPGFRAAMLFVQHVFAGNAHGRPPDEGTLSPADSIHTPANPQGS